MKKIVKRDINILKHLRGEISLSTRVKSDKSKFSRKTKHKKSSF
jgi:hypothetical protein